MEVGPGVGGSDGGAPEVDTPPGEVAEQPGLDAEAGRVRVRFVDGLGVPLADIPVEVAWWRAFGDYGDRQLRTDEDGCVPSGVDEPWQIDSVSTNSFGGRPPLYHSGPFRSAPSNPDEVRVRVGAPGQIGGRILGPMGEPVANAEVRLGAEHVHDPEPWVHRLAGYGHTARTDVEGRFAFEAVSGIYDLEVGQGHGVTESARVEYRSEEGPLELEFRSILGTRGLGVEVVLPEGSTGEPSVWATWSPSESLRSGVQRGVRWKRETLVRRGSVVGVGRFQIDGLHDGDWTLHVRARACHALQRPIDPGATELSVRLEASDAEPTPRAVMLRGIVRGLPERSSARISIRDPLDLGRRFDHATGLEGRFEFSLAPLRGGSFYVMAEHRDRALQVLGPFDGSAPPSTVEFMLEAGLELRGRVVDGDGHPVVAVLGLYPRRTWLEPHGSEDPGAPSFLARSLFQGRRTTDAAGEFSFRSLDGGTWELWAWPEDGRGPPARRVVRGGEAVELVLGEGLESMARLEGKVFDAETREPLGGARVGARRLDTDGARLMSEGLSDPEGHVPLEGLVPGTYSFLVEHRGYAFFESGAIEMGPGATGLELPLSPASLLRLELRDRRGRALGGWEVRAFDRGGRGIGLQDGYGGWEGEVVRTDASGRVELAGLPRGEVSVVVGEDVGEVEGVDGLGDGLWAYSFDLRVPGDGFRTLELDTR